MKTLLEGRELKNGYSSLYLNSLVQRLPVGTKVKLDFMRDGVVKPASLVVGIDRDWAWFERGAIFQPARQSARLKRPKKRLCSLERDKREGKQCSKILAHAFYWKNPSRSGRRSWDDFLRCDQCCLRRDDQPTSLLDDAEC